MPVERVIGDYRGPTVPDFLPPPPGAVPVERVVGGYRGPTVPDFLPPPPGPAPVGARD